MGKSSFCGLIAFLAVIPAIADSPAIEAGSVSIGRRVGSMVEISYVLTGGPAIVTIDIETNALADATGEWASVGGTGAGDLGGEANKIVYVTNTPAKAYWNPSAAIDGRVLSAGRVRATVAAWPTNMPPDYMVVDLRPGYDGFRRWFASTNDVPGGVGDVRYRTTKLLMRKIPAKGVVWKMGSPLEIGVVSGAAVSHKVKLTRDYYAGVFELTVGQLRTLGILDMEEFGASVVSDYLESPVADLIPAERIGYYASKLRGSLSDYLFVRDGHSVAPDSIVDLLRRRTDIADIDLPTEAEWEYACRAGSASETLCNMEFNEANTLLFARINENQYVHALGDANRVGPAPVGTLRPNDWGLYDTLGNVNEICLDLPVHGANSSLYQASLAQGWADGAVTEDPKGPESSSLGLRSMVRGAHWKATWSGASINNRNNSAKEGNLKPTDYGSVVGVRLFCSVLEAVK